jgi:pilus assembly protein FimV
MNKSIQSAAFAAALLLAGGAQALTIGEIDVKSLLGERFDASIPIHLAAGEDLNAGCVRLEDSPNSKYKNVPVLFRYTMTMQRSGSNVVIRLVTNEGFSEPVVRIGLSIRCGAKMSTSREFMVTQRLADTPKR